MLYGKVSISNDTSTMDIEQYKAQPFKYNGECNPIPISDVWSSLERKTRREIERLVKKGKNPNIIEYL